MSKEYQDAQTFDLRNVNAHQDWVKLSPKEASFFINTDFRKALGSRSFKSCATDMSDIPLPTKATTEIPKAASSNVIASPPKAPAPATAPTKTATPSSQPMFRIKHEKFTPYVPMVTRSSGPAKPIAGARNNNPLGSSRAVSSVKPVNLNASGSKPTVDKKTDTNSIPARNDRRFGTEKDPNKVLPENSRTYKTDNGQEDLLSKVATLTEIVVPVKAGVVSTREHGTGFVCTQDTATKPGHQQSLTIRDGLPELDLDLAAGALPTHTPPASANYQSNSTVGDRLLKPEAAAVVAPASTIPSSLDQQPNMGDGDRIQEPKNVLMQVTVNSEQIPCVKKVRKLAFDTRPINIDRLQAENLDTIIVDRGEYCL